MTAAKRNLYIEQGATFALSFVWREGTAAEPGDPVDLTGCMARMQVRKNLTGPALVDAYSEGTEPRITLGGVDGSVRIVLTDEDTSAVDTRSGIYDLEVVMADGTVCRLLQGNVTVSPEVTRDDG